MIATESQEVLLPEIAKGVHAGALEAINTARRYGTKLVIWRDGKIAEITPDEAEAQLREREKLEQRQS